MAKPATVERFTVIVASSSIQPGISTIDHCSNSSKVFYNYKFISLILLSTVFTAAGLICSIAIIVGTGFTRSTAIVPIVISVCVAPEIIIIVCMLSTRMDTETGPILDIPQSLTKAIVSTILPLSA